MLIDQLNMSEVISSHHVHAVLMVIADVAVRRGQDNAVMYSWAVIGGGEQHNG